MTTHDYNTIAAIVGEDKIDALRDAGVDITDKPTKPTTDLFGRWAKHPAYGDVMITVNATDEDGEVWFAFREDGERGQLTSASHIDTLTFPEETTRPEDVSVGETWVVNVDDGEYSAERINAVKIDGDKWVIGSRENIAKIWKNCEVTLLTPLIPARPQDQGQPSDLTPPEQATRPEEIPVGEAWLVNADDGYESAEGITAFKINDTSWVTGDSNGIIETEWGNGELELITPLVPLHPQEPETVTTQEEYESLPVGSIVARDGGDPYVKVARSKWKSINNSTRTNVEMGESGKSGKSCAGDGRSRIQPTTQNRRGSPMGMYDSFIDRAGREWQTKELDSTLQVWRLGDKIESEYLPERATVNIRVYDYDETKKGLVDATVKVVNGVVKSIRPDKEH